MPQWNAVRKIEMSLVFFSLETIHGLGEVDSPVSISIHCTFVILQNIEFLINKQKCIVSKRFTWYASFKLVEHVIATFSWHFRQISLFCSYSFLDVCKICKFHNSIIPKHIWFDSIRFMKVFFPFNSINKLIIVWSITF